MRIQQELLLGVGGSRALRALGITPSVYHLNEGHSAFAILEWARHRVQTDGLDPWKAIKEASAGTVFTTHTPVEAGHDRFPADLAAEHLQPLAEGLKLPLQDVLGLGRVDPARPRLALPAHGAGPQVLPPRQRRLGPARRGLPQHVAVPVAGPQGGGRPHRPHHQRRAHCPPGSPPS